MTPGTISILALPFLALAALAAPDAAASPATAAAVAGPPMPAGSWRPPVGGAVLRVFRVGSNPYARGQHRGVDLQAQPGTAVRSACGGRVSFAGRVPAGGRTVSVRCGPLSATYQHLGTVGVRAGQALAPGAPLGTAGRSSDPRTRDPHVHLGVRDTASGRYVDPLSLLRGAARPGIPLLPPGSRGGHRPLPLGPAPAPSRPLPRDAPTRRAPDPVAPALPAPASQTRPAKLPWPVWAGAASIALALPAGGLLTVRRRRRRTPGVAGQDTRHAVATAR